METVTFEVENQPGVYMWTPGSDPIAFTDPTQLGLFSVGLNARALTGKVNEAMYARLFTKPIPVNVTVPPITIPPIPAPVTVFPTYTVTATATPKA